MGDVKTEATAVSTGMEHMSKHFRTAASHEGWKDVRKRYSPRERKVWDETPRLMVLMDDGKADAASARGEERVKERREGGGVGKSVVIRSVSDCH